MTISWYGHSCFRFLGKDASVLIDPFSKEIGLRPPRPSDDIFLVTHDHSDHNNVKEIPAGSFIVKGPGEYEKSGVYIEGISSFHDDSNGSERGLNTIYVLEMEGIRICHLGDLGQSKLSDEQVEMIGDVDLLFVPIGGKYTIDGAQATEVIRQIEPKIIVPMHYKIGGLNLDVDGPQKFLKEVGIKPEEVETLKIQARNLPTEGTKLIMFKI